VLAVLFSSCIIVTFRLFSMLKIDNLQAIIINYLVASVLSFVSFDQSFSPIEIIHKPWFFWAVINGFLFIIVFFVFAHSAQKAGVAITAVASKMSVVIPVSIGIVIYGDSYNLLKIAGILLAFPSFLLIFSQRQKGATNQRYILLPIILFFGTGGNDSIMKHAQKFYVADEYLLFLGTIFTLSLIIGVIFRMFSPKRLNNAQITSNWKSIAGGIVLGILNYLSTMYFLKSLAIFESSVFFPVFNVSVVSMGALIGLLIFKEKLHLNNWLGILLAMATITFIALS